VKQQTAIGGLYGAGVAYEISPSFDIRGISRICYQVPTFSESTFATNKWFNVFNPAIGVAYTSKSASVRSDNHDERMSDRSSLFSGPITSEGFRQVSGLRRRFRRFLVAANSLTIEQ